MSSNSSATASELNRVLDKVKPLQEEQKTKKDALLAAMTKSNQTEVTIGDRTFRTYKKQKMTPINFKTLKTFYEAYQEDAGGEFDLGEFLQSVKDQRKETAKEEVALKIVTDK